MSITTQICTHSTRTSVISNFTLPIASPSAIAKKEVRVGCPTIDASVSRCWWVSQSLERGSSVHHLNKRNRIMLTISTNLHGLKHKNEYVRIPAKADGNLPVPVYRACTITSMSVILLKKASNALTMFQLGICSIPEFRRL